MIFIGFLFVCGLALPIGLLGPGQESILVTFFGLMAAGIIPALSLVVSNAVSPTFSVAKLKDLSGEMKSLTEQLVITLGAILIGAFFIFIASYDMPRIPRTLLNFLPEGHYALKGWMANTPERVLQACTFVAFIFSVDRLRLVAKVFSRVRELQFDLAIIESKYRLRQNAPTDADVKASFPTSATFGERANVEVEAEK